MKDGKVEIVVVEGFIANVVVEAPPGFGRNRELVQGWADRLTDSRPLHIDTLERYLLLLNDLPGLRARSGAVSRAVIRRSLTPGASDLVLQIEERPLEAFADINNRGNRFQGRYLSEFGVTLNSLLGLHESTEFRFRGTLSNDELRLFSVSHSQLVGSEGTVLTLQGLVADTDDGATLEPIDSEGDTLFLAARLAHPIIRSRRLNLYGNLDFDFLDAETEISRSTLIEDRITSLRIGLEGNFVDSFNGISLFSTRLSQGLDAFDPTKTGSAQLSRSRRSQRLHQGRRAARAPATAAQSFQPSGVSGRTVCI